jgi:hypothetical protein
MGQILRQCIAIPPTSIHCVWCCPVQRPVNSPDLKEFNLLHHLHLHLYDRRHVRGTGQDFAEVWMAGKSGRLAQPPYHVYCVSHLDSIYSLRDSDSKLQHGSSGPLVAKLPGRTRIIQHSRRPRPHVRWHASRNNLRDSSQRSQPSHLQLRRLHDVLRIHV